LASFVTGVSDIHEVCAGNKMKGRRGILERDREAVGVEERECLHYYSQYKLMGLNFCLI